ncbi:MAG: hypothetical protein EU551_01630 [Promethearchaeota archaeon]|nr:MAG: hypothetical protein EU551_01630 [Candidatus Lokiarchaeota archaeon]
MVDNTNIIKVSCSKCGEIFKIGITDDTLKTIDRFPFPIVLMHISHSGDKNVHTLIAYIDRDLRCRHVEYLVGKKVYITPYILYNPAKLVLSCNKIGK